MRYAVAPSPIGHLVIAGEPGLVRRVDFSDSVTTLPADLVRDDSAFSDAVEQLAAYFAGELTAFDLQLDAGGTAFQRSVWEALQSIPYGTTTTYGQLAAELGLPRAVRAVGVANGRNPISVIVPCHRVIGANGSLTGYGGGLGRKQWLLAHERGIRSAALVQHGSTHNMETPHPAW